MFSFFKKKHIETFDVDTSPAFIRVMQEEPSLKKHFEKVFGGKMSVAPGQKTTFSSAHTHHENYKEKVTLAFNHLSLCATIGKKDATLENDLKFKLDEYKISDTSLTLNLVALDFCDMTTGKEVVSKPDIPTKFDRILNSETDSSRMIRFLLRCAYKP